MSIESVPEASYGILQADNFDSILEDIAEQVRRLGYAVLDSGYSKVQLQEIAEQFDLVREQYLKTWGESRLQSLNEFYTIRAMLTHGGAAFLQLAMNPNVMAVLQKLILGTFTLNQQNGIINPPGETFNQGAWHRDLPYQHYVSSTPLAVNALFCVDDFNYENGSTFVLPASHKAISFPSKSYLKRNALQVKAKAGQFIVLDCMLFHCAGFNRSAKERRAINHVYNIPFFKQQINLPGNMDIENLSLEAKTLLGVNFQEPASIETYLASRSKKGDA